MTDSTGYRVVLRTGALRGTSADGVHLFGGIPYAAPAIGPNRFAPPTPVVAWSGELDAGLVGPSLPQLPCFGAVGAVYGTNVPSSPGALTLNIRTPDPGRAGLPVLVWIHGGGFSVGSGSDALYQHGSFARDGVVEVTVNYRLGVEGFGLFDDPTRGRVANLGMHDQIAALQWVSENIDRFGGDPSRVTVAGHSAGAMTVATLMTIPTVKPLFRRAIIQSAAAPLAIDSASAIGVTRYLGEVLGIDAHDLTALAAVPSPALLEAQQRLSDESFNRITPERFGTAARTGMAFVPVIDGELITEDPMQAIARGAAAGIEVLGGSTRDEVMLHVDHAMGGNVPDEATGAFVLDSTAAGFGPFATEIVETYRRLRPDLADYRIAGAINSDAAFGQPTSAIVELASLHSTAFAYRFDEPTVLDGRDIGAIHGAELGYVFDSTDDATARRLSGTIDAALAAEVHRAWTGFVTDGRPSAPGLPDWPAYDATSRSTMLLAASGSHVAADPASVERALWAKVFTALAGS